MKTLFFLERIFTSRWFNLLVIITGTAVITLKLYTNSAFTFGYCMSMIALILAVFEYNRNTGKTYTHRSLEDFSTIEITEANGNYLLIETTADGVRFGKQITKERYDFLKALITADKTL